MEKNSIKAVTEQLLALYLEYGDADYIGEPVSQLEHMCQAAMIAESEGADDEMILAAFLHDIGHLFEFIQPVESMSGVGVVDHEKLAEIYLLELGFSSRVAKLVKSHVDAKRYLTFKFPDYHDQLSEASKETLKHQGGLMTAEEAALFEADPLFHDYLKLRNWDDKAKIQGVPLKPIEFYKNLMICHLQKNVTDEKGY